MCKEDECHEDDVVLESDNSTSNTGIGNFDNHLCLECAKTANVSKLADYLFQVKKEIC